MTTDFRALEGEGYTHWTHSPSRAARAVLNAAAKAMECPDDFLPYELELMAAALRAAAGQVVPADPDRPERWEERDEIRADILAIATELENAQ